MATSCSVPSDVPPETGGGTRRSCATSGPGRHPAPHPPPSRQSWGSVLRPLDPQHGARTRDDRAVRGPQVRDGRRLVRRCRPTATTSRVADEFKIFTNVYSTVVDPKNFDPRSFVDFQGRRLHRAAELVRAGAHGRVLPHPAQRAHGLRRQEHLRALRHHRQRHAVRARVGGLRDARDLATPRRCRRRSTPTRASPRCCSSRATSRARCPTRTRRASTSSSAA